MKFEPPIAEIERFPLRDIISASNGDTDEDLPTESAEDPSNFDMIFDPCIVHVERESDNWDTCL